MTEYVRGMRQLQNRIHELGDAPKDILREVQLQTILRARDSVQVRSGKTRNSIRSGGLTASYAIVRAGGAARYLELGTRAHDIRPRNKQALFFSSQQKATERLGSRARLRYTRRGLLSEGSKRRYGNAAFVLTKLVHHPGQQATPFLVPSAEDAVDNVGVKRIIDAWNRGA